jgi:hypothetical protein
MSKIKIDIKTVPIEDVYPNPWNPNMQSTRVEEATTESIATYGMLDPLTVRPHPEEEGKYQIIDGAHRQASCLRLDYKEIPVNIVHGLSNGEAKKLTIIANETRGYAEKVSLAQLLAELKPEFDEDLITGLPYYQDELDDLINLAKVDWEDFSETFQGTADEDSLENFVISHPQEGAESFNSSLEGFLEKFPDAKLERK